MLSSILLLPYFFLQHPALLQNCLYTCLLGQGVGMHATILNPRSNHSKWQHYTLFTFGRETLRAKILPITAISNRWILVVLKVIKQRQNAKSDST